MVELEFAYDHQLPEEEDPERLNDSDYRRMLADAYAERGRIGEAIHHYKRVARRSATPADTHTRLAD
ncbi:MAG: hypothetical protein ACE5JM_09210, partial [Armatimonadota bacterium]